MADLKLKRIRLRNWEKVRAAEIVFPDRGLVLVIGSNLASGGKLQSVGAGKTSLGEALARTLTGITGRFKELGHFAPDEAPRNLFVGVEAELLGKPLLVEMGFKCEELSKTGEGLRFQYDGASICRGHVDQTREELCRTLRITPELANWTVFLDGDKLRFNRLSQEEAVNLLMMALAQPMGQYHEQALRVLRDAEKNTTLADQTLRQAKGRQQRLEEALEDAVEEHEQAERSYQREVEQLEATIAGLKRSNTNDRVSTTAAEEAITKSRKQLKLLEEQHAAHNHQLDIRRQELRDQAALIEQECSTALEARSEKETDRRQASRILEDMRRVPKNCPTCGKPWDKAHSEEELTKASTAWQMADAAYKKADTAYRNLDATRQNARTTIRQIEDQMDDHGHLSDVRTFNDAVTRNDRLVRDLTATIQQRDLRIIELAKGPEKTFVNKKAAVVEERTRALEEGKQAIVTAAQDLAAEEQVLAVVKYWQRAFSPTGISNMLLTEAIDPLNLVARRISGLMTGGTIAVSYATSRQLASGDSKAQLVIKVDNKLGSKRPEGSSKGEGGLSNLIVAENLSEVGQVSHRMGFRWYDEITTGQDERVRRAIFAYLKDVAQRLGILIFVVDHHVEVAAYADYVLVAEKTVEHGTRFFWK